MRRFLAFAMCVSGFTLTFSWSRADEPAVAATADDAESAEEAAPPRSVETADPPSRRGVVRTEPGSYRKDLGGAGQDDDGRPDDLPQELMRRIEELQAKYATPEFVEQQQHRLEKLHAKLERLADRYSDEALEVAQEAVESQIALIEDVLANADKRRAAIIAQIEDESAEDRSSDDTPNPARRPDAYREMQRRRERAQHEVSERVEQRLQQLTEMMEELAESGAEEAEAVRDEIEKQIDRLEHYLAERRERRDARDGSSSAEVAEMVNQYEAALERARNQLKLQGTLRYPDVRDRKGRAPAKSREPRSGP